VGDGVTSDVIKNCVENRITRKKKKYMNKLKNLILNNLYICP
jgi:hypothetical protein